MRNTHFLEHLITLIPLTLESFHNFNVMPVFDRLLYGCEGRIAIGEWYVLLRKSPFLCVARFW